MTGRVSIVENSRHLKLLICGGLLVGGAVGTLSNLLKGFEPWQIYRSGVVGALGGGVFGLAAAVRLGVVRSGERAGRPEDLWDRWIDDQDFGPMILEGEPEGIEVEPGLAIVRPRVISRAGGAAFPLEDEILPFAKSGARGAVWIGGPPASGKTSALRHLAGMMPPELGLRILDEPDEARLTARTLGGLVVYASEAPVQSTHLATFRLATWGDDELIEYLLEAGREQCASVMARLKECREGSLLQGNPELWRVVLDRMIADERIKGVRNALRREIISKPANASLRKQVQNHCLATLLAHPEPPTGNRRELEKQFRDAGLAKLVRHRLVQILIAADRIALDLANPEAPCDFLAKRLPRELVREAGVLVGDHPGLADRLKSFFDKPQTRFQPMAASLLHAGQTGWRPSTDRPRLLSGAYLDRISWPGIDLRAIQMEGVEMNLADLTAATLDSADANNAQFRRANLRGASLVKFSAVATDLSHSDLSKVQADGAKFAQANLEGARLESASLTNVLFERANLTNARFLKADLTGANLEKAKIDGADFTGAILESAVLTGLKLSQAEFAGARFPLANLTGCDLEGMELPKAEFLNAILQDALLTGSIMPGADFRGADLRGAGLAEVGWEGVCLLDADLRKCSFHMGSSRSGLVNSPIASEGSRTGFYTDDLDEQDFKSPEEIRKADLRGADLRGAKILGVDFYLVDLRGARFDAKQADHFRRCGAILTDRVAE